MAIVAAALVTMAVVPAAAQTRPAQTRPAAPKKQKEFVLGLTMPGPTSLGETTADLLNGSGNPITLLRTRNSLGWGFGLETGVGWEMKKSLWLEATGSWTRTSLKSDVREDLEGAQGDEVSSPVSRFVFEAAMVKYFREKGTAAWFLRVDGGWGWDNYRALTTTGTDQALVVPVTEALVNSLRTAFDATWIGRLRRLLEVHMVREQLRHVLDLRVANLSDLPGRA